MSAILLLGCGSKELSRSKAADLIGSNKEFGTPWEIKIPVGNFWWDSRELGTFPAPLQTLIAANILTVRESGQEVGGSLWYYREYLSELTPHGKDLSKTWVLTKENIASANVGHSCYSHRGEHAYDEPCHPPHGVVYSVVGARRKLREVTGIMVNADGQKSEAEFEWEWVIAANAKTLQISFPADAQKGKGSFRLYDDGWRMKEIALQ